MWFVIINGIPGFYEYDESEKDALLKKVKLLDIEEITVVQGEDVTTEIHQEAGGGS